MNEALRTSSGGSDDPREGLEGVVVAEVLVSKWVVHRKHARRIRDKYPGEPLRRMDA